MAKSATSTYRVNWRIEGLGKRPLDAGDTVDLLHEEAAPLLVSGAISPQEA